MKTKTTLLGLFLMASFSLLAQNFINEGKQWNVLFNGFPDAQRTIIYTIDGQSEVEGILYHHMWISYDSLNSQFSKYYIRETDNKVYFKPTYGDEYLLYDFNLQKGDETIIGNEAGENIHINVLNVDTVIYFGVERKRWTLKASGEATDQWIEGVGSIQGPLQSFYWETVVCPSWELTCSYQDTDLTYKKEGATYCYYESLEGLEEHTASIQCQLSPNPISSGQNLLLHSSAIVKTVNIYNAKGSLVHRLRDLNHRDINIATAELSSGLYFISILTQDNRQISRKLLVQ